MAISAIAGNYAGGIRLTCILCEGTATVTSDTMNAAGTFETGVTFDAALAEGMIVALSNDSDNTYVATGGLPVVERPQNTEGLIIGQIVSSPTLVTMPTSTTSEWATNLSNKTYRIAEVELWGFTKVTKASVTTASGSNHIVPGVATKLNYDISLGVTAGSYGLQFVTASSNGAGFIPFHYVDDSATSIYSCLVGVTTGLGYAVS